ncbi:MAG: hypothetical protein Q9162_002171 [Coniocarpon cinnabarinum]
MAAQQYPLVFLTKKEREGKASKAPRGTTTPKPIAECNPAHIIPIQTLADSLAAPRIQTTFVDHDESLDRALRSAAEESVPSPWTSDQIVELSQRLNALSASIRETRSLCPDHAQVHQVEGLLASIEDMVDCWDPYFGTSFADGAGIIDAVNDFVAALDILQDRTLTGPMLVLKRRLRQASLAAKVSYLTSVGRTSTWKSVDTDMMDTDVDVQARASVGSSSPFYVPRSPGMEQLTHFIDNVHDQWPLFHHRPLRWLTWIVQTLEDFAYAPETGVEKSFADLKFEKTIMVIRGEVKELKARVRGKPEWLQMREVLTRVETAVDELKAQAGWTEWTKDKNGNNGHDARKNMTKKRAANAATDR